MKPFVRQILFVLISVCFAACSHGRSRAAAAEPAVVKAAPRHTETFTGEVVKRSGEYRFKLMTAPKTEGTAEAEPEQLVRLSRSKNAKEFASDEIKLRKYYGKIIVVKGQLDQDWIAKAELETRGVTFTEEIRPAAGGGRVLFFKDGEGNLLHLVERPADFSPGQ